MKIKNPPITTLILAAISVIVCYSSCSKHLDCSEVLYTGQNPFIYLQINNSQNKNLLDPSTPGHYDTAMIKRLNGDKIQLSRPGTLPVKFIFNYTTTDIANRIISISATDHDTLNVLTAVNTQGCNITVQLNTVRYNGVTLMADTGTLYIAHK